MGSRTPREWRNYHAYKVCFPSNTVSSLASLARVDIRAYLQKIINNLPVTLAQAVAYRRGLQHIKENLHLWNKYEIEGAQPIET